ncbi:MAG: hypothetical protein KDA60_20735, partial [Planctomycetales bacterium]|nr:hypothetical protein [Planctomycetales bacterium]
MKWWTNRKKRRLTETLEFAAEGLETRRMLATFAVNGTDFTTIQSAVDAAAANPGADTVLISSGTYAENVLVQDAGPVTLLGDTNAVTIQGGVGNAV